MTVGMATLMAVVAAIPNLGTEDWSQWRGPTRDAQIEHTNWPKSLDALHLQASWRVPLGPSYSGPIVVGNRVFVTETRNNSHEVVTALDRRTGEELWKAEWSGAMNVPFFAAANGSWIRSTPTCDGKFLYVMGIRDVLVALDIETGTEVWRVDFPKQFKTEIPAFGAVCSPLVDGDFIFVQAAFAVVKIRKANGEIIWRSSSDAGGAIGQSMGASPFSSPVIATLAGKRQIIAQARTRMVGVDIDSGRELWSQSIPATRGMNILTPLVIGDSIFTSSHGGATFLFTVTQNAAAKLSIQESWRTKQQAYMSSPVLIGNDVYLHLKNQRFSCLDISTGKAQWTTTPFGKYWSMIANGNQVLSLDERGDLRLIAANPEKYTELSKRKVSEQPSWAHLAYSNGQIFIRSLDSITAWTWK
ncbi:MAG: PQQ-binding-like beta-propeller repeat protein [Planctomycetales bacterium]|nr:PQQ-binding-like beta-propeller repeat protein [Planctomycetales bacterium]